MFFGNRRMMGKWTLSRKSTMMTGGACFFIGALLQALGVTVAMLYIGRILLGIGIGFANQVRLTRFLSCSFYS
jgi:MFS family permease